MVNVPSVPGFPCTKKSPWTGRVLYHVSQKGNGALLWSGYAYWVRVRVENVGRTRAEKVQVYATKLAKLALDNTFEDVSSFLPLNMRWANLPEGFSGAILDGISPKMAAFCDLVCISDPAANPHLIPGAAANTTIGVLQMEAPIEAGFLPSGKYELTLRIAAANAAPIDKVLQFKHTGVWSQDENEMRRECLEVSLRDL